MPRFHKIICWLFGHRFGTVSQFGNDRSRWGYRECDRCQHCEPWQHDDGFR